MGTTEERVVDLEIRYSHLERLVEELNQVVYEQSKIIESFRAELLRLRQRFDEPGDEVPNEPPPHY